MNQWKNSSPVVIGGVGGSGTRIIAAILKEIGYYIGSDLNRALDNLWSTLLFKRPRWFYKQKNLHSEVFRGLSVFEKIIKNNGRITFKEYQFLASALAEIILYGHDYLGSGRGLWSIERIKTILQWRKLTDTDGFTGWGWKEPNTHIFIEYLNDYFAGLRYVHVIRHGMDMAFSRNQAQLYNWGDFLGVKKPRDLETTPAASLDYWIKSNNRAISLGNSILGNRFLLVNFDQLQMNPQNEIARFLEFINYDFTDTELINRLCKLIRKPESLGRYQKYDLTRFPKDSLNEVKKLGFNIES